MKTNVQIKHGYLLPTAKKGKVILPVRDCTKEFQSRPLHTIFGNPEAIAKMEQEFPNHWSFHPRRRYGKTERDKARGHNPLRKNRRIFVKGEGWVKG